MTLWKYHKALKFMVGGLMVVTIAFCCFHTVITVKSANNEGEKARYKIAINLKENNTVRNDKNAVEGVKSENAAKKNKNVEESAKNVKSAMETNKNAENSAKSAGESKENIAGYVKNTVENADENAVEGSGENAVENMENASKNVENVIENEFTYFENAGDIEKITIQEGSTSGYFSTSTVAEMYEGTTVKWNRRGDIGLRGRDGETVVLSLIENRISVRLPTKNRKWKTITVNLWEDTIFFYGPHQLKKFKYVNELTMNISNIRKLSQIGNIRYGKTTLKVNGNKDWVTVCNVAANITVRKLHLLSKRVPLKLNRNSTNNKNTVIELSTDSIVYERRHTGDMNIVVCEEEIQIRQSPFSINLTNKRGNLHFAPNERVTIVDTVGKCKNVSLIDHNLFRFENENGTVEMRFGDELGRIYANYSNEILSANVKTQSFSLKNRHGKMCLRHEAHLDVTDYVNASLQVDLLRKTVKVGLDNELDLPINGWIGGTANSTRVKMTAAGKVSRVETRIGVFEDFSEFELRNFTIRHASGYASLYKKEIGAYFDEISFYNYMGELLSCCGNTVKVLQGTLQMSGAAGSVSIEGGSAIVESAHIKISIAPFHFKAKFL